ncbi:trans-acting enoyl reductase family protein, partial [Nocardia sp. CNY236]|uniref:saccharopine dehydrogenase family protein n=1 Tax=Nocardia sp. CNY236 TaxID=1169152 RepID=UPI00048C7BF0
GAREFDLVLFGATGFVGTLTAQYLAGAAPESARIALAGRSLDKLTTVRDDLGPTAAGWELIVVDATDRAALETMTARTTVVVTTVGPYLRYGMPLLGACAATGTHYADLTGEALFIRDAIDAYHEQAAATGAKIVNSCGFDSIPSDLSVYRLYRRTIDDNTGELTDTTLVASAKGGFSGGTVDSARATMEAINADSTKIPVMTHPYSLSPDKSQEPDLGRQSDRVLARARTIDPSLKGWVGTFIMAGANTRLVRRTNGLLGWPYGKNFRYREAMNAGTSLAAPLLAAGMAGVEAAMVAGTLLSRSSGGRKLLDLIVPKPGTGPSAESRAKGWFSMKTYAHTTSGAKYVATFSGSGDPGYQSTATLLGESGLCLAFDGDRQSELAGILTPAAAMGDALTERLRAAGMTITVDRA